jgi:hypothetical protein
MLLALLICVATVHDDATHDRAGHAVATAASTITDERTPPGDVPDGSLTAPVGGHAGEVGHGAHRKSCDGVSSIVWRAGILASPDVISTPPAAAAGGDLAAAAAVHPMARPGRALLLKVCVSRT